MHFPGVSTADPLLYYCDESHIRGWDYVGVGGLAIRPSRAAEVVERLATIREECKYTGSAEIKWETCKKRRACVHQAYANYLFDSIEKGHLHLHVRLSPFKDYDHAISGERRETDTVSKAFYQLLLHRAGRYYGTSCRLLIRPDSGDCTSYLPNMKEGLNTDICLKFAASDLPIADIAPRDSKKEPLLQLLDIALGALTAARNGKIEDGRLAPQKLELARLVLERGKIKDITKSHPREQRDFNVWNVVPQWTRSAIPTR
jgi:Protein of unknown function (DUF3800)